MREHAVRVAVDLSQVLGRLRCSLSLLLLSIGKHTMQGLHIWSKLCRHEFQELLHCVITSDLALNVLANVRIELHRLFGKSDME